MAYAAGLEPVSPESSNLSPGTKYMPGWPSGRRHLPYKQGIRGSNPLPGTINN